MTALKIYHVVFGLRVRRDLLRVAAVLIVLGGVISAFQEASAGADADPSAVVKIGALANRGSTECQLRWQPTAAYLDRHIEGFKFEIVPLGFDELYHAVREGKLDFLIANSSIYAELEYGGSVHRIATFLVASSSGVQNRFGGVIFCREDRSEIQTLKDLSGKRFGAVDADSLGGWHAAWRELRAFDIQPRKDLSELHFYGTHDAGVENVLRGSVDAGTVRSTQLETMAAEGSLDLDQIRVVEGSLAPPKDYPFLLSTCLYPEWPFAAVKGTADSLSRKVAAALLAMTPEDTAAQASQGAG